ACFESANQEPRHVTGADQCDRFARSKPHLINCMQRAREWLSQRGGAEAHTFRQRMNVVSCDVRGNANVFGIRAVYQFEIVAQLRRTSFAKETMITRRRVQNHDSLAFSQSCQIRTNFTNNSRQLMSKRRRRAR